VSIHSVGFWVSDRFEQYILDAQRNAQSQNLEFDVYHPARDVDEVHLTVTSRFGG